MSKGELKRPQSVLVVVCTRQGEFLLMQRTRPKGFWQSVTGSLDPGETPRLAAAREVFEETGIRAGGGLIDLHQSVLFPIIPAWRRRYALNVCFNREYWFALVLDSRRHVRLSQREHLTSRWLSAPEAVELTGSWTNRDAIQRVACVLDPMGGCGTTGQGGRSIRRTSRVIDSRFRRALSKT
ncbi:dihydroneopterin triphosphate diphosphatase [Thiorhodococcus mannitoliphagus]|uniref:Dihydroneopterin triphosphate diphosphatase n=2 Tax=Thiorhodococcus mannitoliphagus TaxID=329406 RepID=A0A6P1DRQ6_9GAMM|nr:dihydroneopterin triphosphate diphosphatase [Thiorhodococcus mannitoliphagus]